MSTVANWISPEVLRTLGWTLLHFIWQGAGLAALFAVGGSSLPKRLGTVRAGRRRARIDAGIASHHVHVVEGANKFGR